MQNSSIEGKAVYITNHDDVVYSGEFNTQSELEQLRPCSHEEAESRIFLHATHASSKGYKRILIRNVDSDVVVVAVGLSKLNVDELWIAICTGKHF